MNKSTAKTVMVFAGTDATAGAGYCADVEAIKATGAYALPIVTAITIQDTHNIQQIVPLDANTVLAQARTILNDMPVNAIKLGLLANADIALGIADLLAEYNDCPLVIDPVLAAGGGYRVANKALETVYTQRLFPLATLACPNSLEARQLTGETDLTGAAQSMLNTGCQAVLITGGHEHEQTLTNVLYQAHRRRSFTLPRLPYDIHGSGCTLAAAIASALAQDNDLDTAIESAQDYTFTALQTAYQLSNGQALPNRINHA